MEEDTKTLDEVIVVGYGTTSKRKTTAAIASVNTEDIIKAPTANITQSLAGRAPGLLVTTSGGGLNNFSSVSYPWRGHSALCNRRCDFRRAGFPQSEC